MQMNLVAKDQSLLYFCKLCISSETSVQTTRNCTVSAGVECVHVYQFPYMVGILVDSACKVLRSWKFCLNAQLTCYCVANDYIPHSL